MWIIAASALLTALGTLAADRLPFLKKHPIRQGVWFGVLAILANTVAVDITGFNVPVGLRNAPPLVAGFFFGPLPGLLAGTVAGVGRALTPLWGVGTTFWVRGALTTFIVAAYGAALSKWVFDGKRPPVVTAAVAAAFGEVLHLALNYCFGFNDMARALEIIYAGAIPMTVGVATAAGLASFFCGSWRGWRNNFYSSLTCAFACFGLAFGVIAAISDNIARHQTNTSLRDAVRNIEHNSDAQIGYMLHCNAVSIANIIDPKQSLTLAGMQRIADEFDVDELNIFDGNGKLIATNNPYVLKSHRTVKPAGPLKIYFDLLNGKRKFVKEKFRPNRSDKQVLTKYIGVPMPDGKAFLQLGYTWDRFEKEFDTFFFPMLADAKFGETGYFLIADAGNRVKVPVGNHPNAEGKTLSELGFSAENLAEPPDRTFYARVDGVWSRCVRYEDIGTWKLYAVLPLVEYHGPAALAVFVSGFVLFAACIVFRMLLLKFLSAQKKIDALREAETKCREADLALARRIQLSQLREDDPDTPQYRIHAVMFPAREVGGDFYDYYELSDGKLVLTVADVSGKGIPAAFFMMRAKAILKSGIYHAASVAEAVTMANRRLNRNNDAFMFVTAWVGVYDPASGILNYVSAGHNPPFVKHADGTVLPLTAPRAAALAVLPNAEYAGSVVQLRPGDTLFLYTDGVTEAMDPSGELYGVERLRSVLAASREEFIPAVELALKNFAAGIQPTDDTTMLTMEIKAL